jgi:hypothetical protein
MQRLSAAGAETHPHLQSVLAEITARMQTARAPSDYDAAKRTVAALLDADKLDDNAVQDLARANKFEEVAVALSAMCRLPIAEIARALQDTDPGLMLIIVRAAGLSWSTTKAILLMPTSGHSTSQLDLDTSERNFERLQTATARRVVRFYQVRQSVGKTASGA